MATEPIVIASEGLEAWRRGDFDALESMLDPAVTWRSFEPGQWDCDGRDDVLRTLRERYEQGFAMGDLSFQKTSEDSVIVISHPSKIGGPQWPDETATVMRFREGKVVSMQDYPTEAEGRADLARRRE